MITLSVHVIILISKFVTLDLWPFKKCNYIVYQNHLSNIQRAPL